MQKISLILSERAEKMLLKLPFHIQEAFIIWGKLVEGKGLNEMRGVKGYREYQLKGHLAGLRSVSLNRSYRVIYKIQDSEKLIVFVIEVNKHDYKI